MQVLSAGMMLTVALVLSGCATTSAEKPADVGARLALTDDLQCRILADLGNELGGNNYDPAVVDAIGTSIDCTSAFQSAGLPIMADAKRSISFHALQFTDDDEAIVNVDFRCGPRCGDGEEIRLQRQGGVWKIAVRKPTWIS